jgi:hypothetical protein
MLQRYDIHGFSSLAKRFFSNVGEGQEFMQGTVPQRAAG